MIFLRRHSLRGGQTSLVSCNEGGVSHFGIRWGGRSKASAVMALQIIFFFLSPMMEVFVVVGGEFGNAVHCHAIPWNRSIFNGPGAHSARWHVLTKAW